MFLQCTLADAKCIRDFFICLKMVQACQYFRLTGRKLTGGLQLCEPHIFIGRGEGRMRCGQILHDRIEMHAEGAEEKHIFRGKGAVGACAIEG